MTAAQFFPPLDPDLAPYAAQETVSDFSKIADLRASEAPAHCEPASLASDLVQCHSAQVPRLHAKIWHLPGPEHGSETGSEHGVIPVRVFAPRSIDASTRLAAGTDSSGSNPLAVLSLHGGGYCLGSAADDDQHNALIASQAGVTVVAVDYRLAPEHPYPAALVDVLSVLHWVRSGALGTLVGAEIEAVGLYGVSAGAGLAAAAALVDRDYGPGNLAFQILLEPAIDASCATDSMRAAGDTPGWNNTAAALSWQHYLGGWSADAYSSPACAEDLSGLPPTFITVNEIDPLRDEGIEFAVRLKRAGVHCRSRLWPGAFHGFFLLSEPPLSRLACAEGIRAVRDLAACAIEQRSTVATSSAQGVASD